MNLVQLVLTGGRDTRTEGGKNLGQDPLAQCPFIFPAGFIHPAWGGRPGTSILCPQFLESLWRPLKINVLRSYYPRCGPWTGITSIALSLLKMQNVRLQHRLSQNLHFNMIPGRQTCTLKFKKHCYMPLDSRLYSWIQNNNNYALNLYNTGLSKPLRTHIWT